MRHYWTSKIIITAVPVLQLTATYNQVEDELAEATTDLFLSHIR
ncbi:integrase [Streptococcus pneumoniae]|nr:integrase [Streptococcus pneumoniae]